MSHDIGSKKRQRLLKDLLAARQDLMTLAKEHHLSADDLANWVNDPKNTRCLTGLCVLADLQTQLLLSRYRLLAAGRLIRIATNEGDDLSTPDVARRACIDLLKLDLKAADAGKLDQSGKNDEPTHHASLRDLLYGNEAAEEAPEASARNGALS